MCLRERACVYMCVCMYVDRSILDQVCVHACVSIVHACRRACVRAHANRAERLHASKRYAHLALSDDVIPLSVVPDGYLAPERRVKVELMPLEQLHLLQFARHDVEGGGALQG